MELNRINRSTIERALGIIEGVACGVPERAADMLYTAVEMIDAVLLGKEEGKT
ncbi:MAG: hypothetical protein IKY91_04835 [Akkermansia sp.]|nr:hypothetical protein [Akkermansia sp.]